ncbi:transaldolase family protein [Streptomyces sp. GESEQ-4]|uniref:transaldolase family protein n=1 Tax=Streptomyces sp. GESEQ-4 TaxID=2812655 RepID=UPI0035A859C0
MKGFTPTAPGTPTSSPTHRCNGCAGPRAIANAWLAYRRYEEMLAGDRWVSLACDGARPQRPLWASTGVKDPAYDDTRYVVEPVAPGVVSTMPEATLHAVADHGRLRGDTVRSHYDEARQVLDDLRTAGIDYDDVMATLEAEGVEKFRDSRRQVGDQLGRSLREDTSAA